jgi:hypothetical protein
VLWNLRERAVATTASPDAPALDAGRPTVDHGAAADHGAAVDHGLEALGAPAPGATAPGAPVTAAH